MLSIMKPNILVVCGRNKKRSRTAEYIFKNDQRFNIKSVGLSPKSTRQIKEADIAWADLIFVMEDGQNARIWGTFNYMNVPPIEVLGIADDYEYLDEELIEMLKFKIDATIKYVYKI